MAMQWCKVSASLDSHPKIRRAGRLGREVFLFALRRNAMAENPIPGMLPAAVMEPWFIADQLMMTEAEATSGTSLASAAGLLVHAGECWQIAGWDEEWGKGDLPQRNAAGGRARAASASRKNGRFAPASPASTSVAGTSLTSLPARSDQIRSDLPERERPTPNKPQPAEPDPLPSKPPTASGDPDPERSRRQAIRREIWRELETARAAVASELESTYRPLPVQDPGERELAMHLAAQDLAVAADLARNAIAVAAEEARRDRSLRWLSGVIFSAAQIRRSSGMDPAKMRAARIAAASPSTHGRPIRVKAPSDFADDEAPPFAAGGKP